MTLLDATLKLTRAERGYIFLKNEDGKLRLAIGRTARGEPLLDDKTISHSTLDDALKSNSEFVITDTSESLDLSGRKSVVAFDLRTVICIPLRKTQVQATRGPAQVRCRREIHRRALPRFTFCISRHFRSQQRHSFTRSRPKQRRSLENARLVQAEEAGRRYQQELAIAASIQQGLMAVTIPDVPFANSDGRKSFL